MKEDFLDKRKQINLIFCTGCPKCDVRGGKLNFGKGYQQPKVGKSQQEFFFSKVQKNVGGGDYTVASSYLKGFISVQIMTVIVVVFLSLNLPRLFLSFIEVKQEI